MEIRFSGASWFCAWLDGAILAEGPARFPALQPEYEVRRVRLTAGRHVLAVQVHHEGVSTRLMEPMAPFLYATILEAGRPVATVWRCRLLPGYAPKARRINPQLGWVEWCDTRLVPEKWTGPDFADVDWPAPVAVPHAGEEFRRAPVGAVRIDTVEPRLVAGGDLVETFGYEKDDPSARFFLRELVADGLPPEGVWWRYDLGRVRLGRLALTLELPAGTVVEFAYAEALTRGRVAPWINWSLGDSCNLAHFTARGGPQEFCQLAPLGGRFIEVHVLAPRTRVRPVAARFLERAYFGANQGSFRCEDERLERIWETGVETLRACAEDSIIDNPTRERGQWAGDVATVGMDIAAAAFGDLRPLRRCLVQCAQSAREDGLVAGMCPGQNIFLSTYAAQWVAGCLNYWEITGDSALLRELWSAAERNIGAFERARGPAGVPKTLGWDFVDWGYGPSVGDSDCAVNLHYLAALRAMSRWRTLIGAAATVDYAGLAEEVAGLIAAHFRAEHAAGGDAWARIGYHRVVLGLQEGFFAGAEARAAVAFLKTHLQRCFPNDPAAPRLSGPVPEAADPRLITPYFAHYVMPLLIEHGELDFVLGQYRACWGWALDQGLTTWPEVFDLRWSHAHQWSGCPTWQLSKYVLGLTPRFWRGAGSFEFTYRPGSLMRAQGRIPLVGTGDAVEVAWQRTGDEVRYRLSAPTPVTIHFPGPAGEKIAVAREAEFALLVRDGRCVLSRGAKVAAVQ